MIGEQWKKHGGEVCEGSVGSFQEEVASERWMVSALGVGEFAFWLGDGAVEGAGGFDPLGDNQLRVGYSFLVGCAVGHAAWEFGDFD